MSNSMWEQRTLSLAIPNSDPDLAFYYKPVSRLHCQAFYLQLDDLGCIENIALVMFSARMMCFTISDGKTFMWPDDWNDQESLLQNISMDVILEVAAQMVGCRKKTTESFMNLIGRMDNAFQSYMR